MTTIYKEDDTAAFGGDFLTVNLNVYDEEGNLVEEQPIITKAEIRIGCITKTFNNPEFPILNINLSSSETACLKSSNNIYMAVWDELGKKRTCEGTISFNATARRV